MPTPTEILPFEQLENEYPIPLGTLKHWARTRRLKSFRLGRRRFVRREDIERLILDAIEADRSKHEPPP
jgi:hypothetical protein